MSKVMSIFDADEAAIREIDGKWYAFGYCNYASGRHDQVFGILKDAPESGMNVANFSDEGIAYVASAQQTREEAEAKALEWVDVCKRYPHIYGSSRSTRLNPEYIGEI